MFFQSLPVGLLEVNCYILAKEDKAVVVDPGGNYLDILGTLKNNELSLEAIINTHGHYDHIGANNSLTEKNKCPVYIHEKELDLLKDSTSNLSVWFEGSLEIDYEIKEVKDGDTIEAGGLDFKVIHTPGHTLGGICLLQGENLFTGDTLFKQSIGRTDLPGSNTKQMNESLRKLSKLSKNLKVFPGHGDSSTLKEELENNPYLK